jgi:hypothetical protein
MSTPRSGIKTVPTREHGNEVSYVRPTAAGGFASIAMTQMTQATQRRRNVDGLRVRSSFGIVRDDKGTGPESCLD